MTKPCIIEEGENSSAPGVKMVDLCTNPDHTQLYSTKRNEYFCPFCPDNPASSPHTQVAKYFDLDLFDYQKEILSCRGHRVVVGGRQIGKTTMAAIEAQVKSTKGKVLSFINSDNNILKSGRWNKKNIHNLTVTTPPAIEEYDYLVIGEVGQMPAKYLLNDRKILNNFEESLICGTPGRTSFRHIANSPNFQMWKIPMTERPDVGMDNIQHMMETMTTEQISKEIFGEFIND